MAGAVDRWTLGHFILGMFLGWTMKNPFYALIFLAGWEWYEVFFRPDVHESLPNRLIDVLVGFLGVLLASAPAAFTA
jgi:hypothetical protein